MVCVRLEEPATTVSVFSGGVRVISVRLVLHRDRF